MSMNQITPPTDETQNEVNVPISDSDGTQAERLTPEQWQTYLDNIQVVIPKPKIVKSKSTGYIHMPAKAPNNIVPPNKKDPK